MSGVKEAHYRSIIKAITWRVLATTATILIVFAFTGRLILSFEVGAVEVITKLALYYFHERIWGFIGVGRKKHPLSSLAIERPLDEEAMQAIKDKLTELGHISENRKEQTVSSQ